MNSYIQFVQRKNIKINVKYRDFDIGKEEKYI